MPDYAQIDCEIRYLVELLNRFSGIRTTFSCAGHLENEETYVSFVSADQESLHRLMRALPFIGWSCRLTRNVQFEWKCLWIDVELAGEQGLTYVLRLSGHPLYFQRRALGEIETALAKALNPPDARLSSPTDVPASNGDSERIAR